MMLNIDQVIANCQKQAIQHLYMATFMKRIGDYKAMDMHMDTAMDWSVHIDLLLQTQFRDSADLLIKLEAA
jgi:cobalamin biosynthesis Co2+ chelatase CbiK